MFLLSSVPVLNTRRRRATFGGRPPEAKKHPTACVSASIVAAKGNTQSLGYSCAELTFRFRMQLLLLQLLWRFATDDYLSVAIKAHAENTANNIIGHLVPFV